MKTTKTQIIRNTTTKKGQGFNPEYMFKCYINNVEFEKPYGSTFMYVTSIEESGRDITNEVRLDGVKKADFIQAVYDYFNN